MRILKTTVIFFIIILVSASKCKKDKDDIPLYIQLCNNSNQNFYYVFSFAHPDLSLKTVNRPSDGNYIDEHNKKESIGKTAFLI